MDLTKKPLKEFNFKRRVLSPVHVNFEEKGFFFMLMFSSLIQEMSISLIFFDDLESFQIFYPYKF